MWRNCQLFELGRHGLRGDAAFCCLKHVQYGSPMWQDEERLHIVVPFVLFIELQLQWDNANIATKIYGCGCYSLMDYS